MKLLKNITNQATLTLSDLSIIQSKHVSGANLTDSTLEPWRFVLSKQVPYSDVSKEDVSFSFTSSENNVFAHPLGLSSENSCLMYEPSVKYQRNYIVKLNYVHDGYIDEVEMDFEPLVVRITPTSLQDSIQGLRRVIEVTQIMGKEMERKVHAESRLAREKYGE